MKTLRFPVLAVFLTLVTSASVWAEGLTISVDRDSMPAKPGEKATIRIDVDIPTSGEIPRPDFFVSIPEGKLKDGRITNGEFINRDFHFLIYISAGRARGGVTVTYEPADSRLPARYRCPSVEGRRPSEVWASTRQAVVTRLTVPRQEFI
jgi:hypothetical protein